MGLLNKFFGYRWSLYVLKNDELHYAMHNDSVIRIIGYIMGYFERNGNPKPPWTLRLNFNKDHNSIILNKNSFNENYDFPSKELMDQIKNIDPNFKVSGGEFKCINVINDKTEMPLSSTSGQSDIKDNLSEDFSSADMEKLIMRSIKRKNVKTFMGVLDKKVFGS